MKNEHFKRLLDNLNIRLCQNIPVIHQTESSECGLACLAMMCGYYGKSIDLIALRQRFNLSARGTTLAGIKKIATQLGMTSRALSLDLHEINALKTPCILHWDFNHFVVLVSVRRNRFILHDPARGRRVVALTEMSQYFTGVALELWPDSDFTVETVKNRIQFFILLRATLTMLRGWSSMIMGTLINVQWQAGLFNHLLGLPLGYFERRRLGDIQSRFGSLNTLRDTFTTSTVGALMDGIMVTGVVVMMMLYGGWLTWIVLFFTSVYILIRILTYNHYRQLSEESLVRGARAGSYFMETLYGIATVKMQGMSECRSSHWLNLEIDTINTEIKITRLNMLFVGINTLISACDQIVILWLGISLVIDNQMTIGMFVAFGVFRGLFSERVGSLTSFLLQLRMMSLHNERIADIALNEPEAIKPETSVEAVWKPVALDGHGLSYSYDSQSVAIFSNLDISISPGESVAIIGPSGSGKTTLMKVLCGLFTPTSGCVKVNGIDIQKVGVNNYRKMIGCIMQDDKLFSGSIRENICGFMEQYDEDWMITCAQASYIHETIMAMPMGYETLIGELGEGLSGGQKQRIFIARALYRKPGILFMDEATSALDKDSELAVNHAIKKLNITRVIIAHRESTIASAERIIRLDS